MKKQYNFVQIASFIEKKLKDPNIPPKERYLLQQEIEYHRGANYKFDLNEKIKSDFSSNLLETNNYTYLMYLLDSFTYYNYKIFFHTRKNRKNELFKLSREVFENIDLNHQKIISDLNSHEYEIYTIKKDKVVDHCFYSEYLKIPFVTISDDSTTLTVIKLIHEMEHQINFVINPFCTTLQFKEAPPIFLELFAAEYLYEKTNDKEYLKAYLSRLKDASELALILKAYLEMLAYYGSNHEVEFKDALNKYKFEKRHIENINVVKILSDLLSFLLALSIKETFKNNQKEGLDYLYSIIDGSIMTNDMNLNNEYERGLEICKTDHAKIMSLIK